MRLSDLQNKEIVNVNDGKNIGNIIWDNITKIGEDVILVKIVL